MKDSVFNDLLDKNAYFDYYILQPIRYYGYTKKEIPPNRDWLKDHIDEVEDVLSKRFYLDFLNEKSMHNSYLNWNSQSLLSKFVFRFEPQKNLHKREDYILEPIDIFNRLKNLNTLGEISLNSGENQNVYNKLRYLCSLKRLCNDLPQLQQYTTSSEYNLSDPVISKFFDESFDFEEFAKNKQNDFEFRKSLYVISSIIDKFKVLYTFDITPQMEERMDALYNYEYGDFANVGAVIKDKLPNLDIFKKPVLNPDLKDFLLKDMPSDLDKLGKALYVYYKMCHTLSYDDDFYNYGYLRKEPITHSNVLDTYNVTPQNNKVICSEFTTIYALMLKELGIIPHIHSRTIINKKNAIDAEFSGKNFPFDGSHVWVEMYIDKYVIRADSTPSIIVGDLAKVKFGGLCKFDDGLRCKNLCDQTLRDFEQTQQKVLDILAKQNIKKVEELQGRKLKDITPEDLHLLKNNQALSLYKKLPDNHYPISLDMRVRLLFNIVEHTQLHGLELMQYIHQIQPCLFTKEERAKMQNSKIKFTALRNDEQYFNPETTVLFSYDVSKKEDEKDIRYYIIDGGKKPEVLTKDDLQQKYNNEEYVNIFAGAQPLGLGAETTKGKVL